MSLFTRLYPIYIVDRHITLLCRDSLLRAIIYIRFSSMKTLVIIIKTFIPGSFFIYLFRKLRSVSTNFYCVIPNRRKHCGPTPLTLLGKCESFLRETIRMDVVGWGYHTWVLGILSPYYATLVLSIRFAVFSVTSTRHLHNVWCRQHLGFRIKFEWGWLSHDLFSNVCLVNSSPFEMCFICCGSNDLKFNGT